MLSAINESDQFKLLKEKISFYQTAPLGAETWLEDHVCVFITDVNTGKQYWCPLKKLPDTPHPITGRSYKQFWDWQKENVIRPATSRNKQGQLYYHTIILCMPRGDGKSYLAALLLLWRFFTQLRQLIVLGSNSRNQSNWAMYDILKDMIVNSPMLLSIIGYEGIREKNIVLRDGLGQVASSIQSVSTFSGILSNLTCYNFTELFQQKNSNFFNQIDGSRRNIPDSQGIIDSTVSVKDHTLYKLYEASSLSKNTDPGIFFLYRYSETADYRDFLHPHMTQMQLNSFKGKFTPADFARYFKNTWELGDTKVFSPAVVRSIQYIGYQGSLGLQQSIVSTCAKQIKYEEDPDSTLSKNLEMDLMPIPYSLTDNLHPISATITDLETLSELYDTQWAIGIGLDLADPLKDDITRGARSIVSCIAKGLPGSRSNPSLHLISEGKPRYIYFLLGLKHVETNEVEDVQYYIDGLLYDFGYINTICSERWGAAGLRPFAEENYIALELISPTYEKQRTGFNEFYRLVRTGYFKCPLTVIAGSREEDIVREEMAYFEHDVTRKWYGSPQKANPLGVQDDCMFSICWNIYGMRELTPDDFRQLNKTIFMGASLSNKELAGKY